MEFPGRGRLAWQLTLGGYGVAVMRIRGDVEEIVFFEKADSWPALAEKIEALAANGEGA
jgi:hypothetical protein